MDIIIIGIIAIAMFIILIILTCKSRKLDSREALLDSIKLDIKNKFERIEEREKKLVDYEARIRDNEKRIKILEENLKLDYENKIEELKKTEEEKTKKAIEFLRKQYETDNAKFKSDLEEKLKAEFKEKEIELKKKYESDIKETEDHVREECEKEMLSICRETNIENINKKSSTINKDKENKALELIYQAKINLKNSKFDDAEKLLSESINIYPTSEAYNLLIMKYIYVDEKYKNDLYKLRKTIDEALDLDKNNKTTLCLFGILHDLLNNKSEAVFYFNKSRDFISLIKLSEYCLDENNDEIAVNTLEQIIFEEDILMKYTKEEDHFIGCVTIWHFVDGLYLLLKAYIKYLNLYHDKIFIIIKMIKCTQQHANKIDEKVKDLLKPIPEFYNAYISD